MRQLSYIGVILLIGCQCFVTSIAEQDVKQIKLEDIEKDNLENENNEEVLQTEQTQSLQQQQQQQQHQQQTEEDNDEEKGESKEPSLTDVRYAQLPYEGPIDIQYVTPSSAPSAPDYDLEPKYYGQPQQYQQQQFQYVPQVHESDLTYTVPARQSLLKPTIGGGAPIQLIPQPQYVYVTAHGNAAAATTAATTAATGTSKPSGLATKTLYQQEQQTQQQNYHSSPLYAPSAVEQQYLAPFPYTYQSSKHIASPPVPPPVVSVPSPAVYSLSHGNTGLDPYQSSNVRPYVFDAPSAAVSPISSYAPSKQVLPLSFATSPFKSHHQHHHHSPKYHTTIEPQLILGPFSLPPTLEYTRPYQPPHPYPHYDLNFIPSGRQPLVPFSPLKFKVTSQSYGHTAPSHAYGPPSYNTIAYSVPYSPNKFKRDSNH